MLIQFHVTDQQLIFLDAPALALQQNIDYIQCKFNTSSYAWQAMDVVVAVFKSAIYVDVSEEVILDDDMSCFMPRKVFQHGGTVQVTLYGDNFEDGKVVEHTVTNPVEVLIREDVNVPIDTPTKYEIAMALFYKALEDAKIKLSDIRVGGNNLFVRTNINNIGVKNFTLTAHPKYAGYIFSTTPGTELCFYSTERLSPVASLYWFKRDFNIPLEQDPGPVVGNSVGAPDAVLGTLDPYVLKNLLVPQDVYWGYIFLADDELQLVPDEDGFLTEQEIDTVPDIMLERGNKATDWTPSYLDTQASLAALEEDVVSFNEEVDNQFRFIQEALKDNIQQTAQVGIDLASISPRVASVEAAVLANTEDISSMFESFTPFTEMIIPDTTHDTLSLRASSTSISLTNTEISLQDSKGRIMHTKDGVLLVPNLYVGTQYPRAKVGELFVGDLAWVARSNGHLSLKLVKGGVS